MRKVFGIGETILDLIFKNDKPYAAVPGGSTFNAMVALARLNVPVSFISELATDHIGDLIIHFMEENHIATHYIDRFPDGKTPVSLAFLNEQNDALYSFYHDFPKERLELPLPDIDENDILVFGSYYALNPVLRPKILEILKYAKERKAIIYYDLNFRKAHADEAIFLTPTALENLELADVVRGSDEDFANLFRDDDIAHLYSEHIQYHCDRFICTHGGKGIDLYQGGENEHYEVQQIQPVSTIGAGDNFNAGIIYGMLQENILREDLNNISFDQWGRIIRHGINLATETCKTNENYIPKEFAQQYVSQS
jgi:fructokinase